MAVCKLPLPLPLPTPRTRACPCRAPSYPVPPRPETAGRSEVILGNWMKERAVPRDKVSAGVQHLRRVSAPARARARADLRMRAPTPARAEPATQATWQANAARWVPRRAAGHFGDQGGCLLVGGGSLPPGRQPVRPAQRPRGTARPHARPDTLRLRGQLEAAADRLHRSLPDPLARALRAQLRRASVSHSGCRVQRCPVALRRATESHPAGDCAAAAGVVLSRCDGASVAPLAVSRRKNGTACPSRRSS